MLRSILRFRLNQSICYYCMLQSNRFSRNSKYSMENEEREHTALDQFTSELTRTIAHKWEIQKEYRLKKGKDDKKCKLNQNVVTSSSVSKIEELDINSINNRLQSAVDFGDTEAVLEIVKQCIEYKKCPSVAVMINVLSVCSQNGCKDMIVELTQLCEEMRPELLENNSNFQHYLAEAIWVKGNVTKSLKIFEEVYRENMYLRRKIRFMIKYLISNALTNRSEAVMVNILNFAEKILQEYHEFYMLGCIWEACILSDWFSDQTMAMQILEKHKHQFCVIIVNKIPHIVHLLLQRHRTEVVFRLFEVLLMLEMKQEYTTVLWALLDYKIKGRDLKSCAEIIQWSLEYDVNIPSVYQNGLLNLLMKKDGLSSIKEQTASTKLPQFKF